MTKRVICVSAAVVALLSGAAAQASQGLFWQFQDTGYFSSDETAVALRSGKAWPVVMNDSGDVYALFATPSPTSGTNWHEIGYNVLPSGFSPKIGKGSSDGRILFASPTDQVVVYSAQGTPSYPAAEAGAFAPDGTLYLGGYGQVAGLGQFGQFNDAIVDMAVAPDGTVGVVTVQGDYYEHRFGQWSPIPVDVSSFGPFIQPDSLRLAFDAQSRPHISGKDGLNIYTLNFSTASGAWVLNSHGPTNGKAVPIASSTVTDALGIAHIDIGSGDLIYSAFDDATATWTANVVPTGGGLIQYQSVGLDFDYAGLPVISYEQFGNIWIAYDPVEVPEPTALALLGVGGLVVMRRRAA